jgi:FAD/FMN-containing dehydrogenase
LLEYDAGTSQAQACYERCVEAGWVADGVLAQSLAQARALWRLREDISETLAPWTPWKSDIAVRLPRMGQFIAEVEESIRAYCAELEVVWYGHIGDGNLHLNVLRPPEMEPESFAARCAALGEQLAARVQEHGGSISAEHGVGLLKKPYLGSSRSLAEIRLLAGLKKVFDPDGILNPGKLLDP